MLPSTNLLITLIQQACFAPTMCHNVVGSREVVKDKKKPCVLAELILQCKTWTHPLEGKILEWQQIHPDT